ncbi:zinc finger CCCH domain-containing protein 14 isoform X2 [Syngnathus acus]|uniref:zinc finger CCCH domain-containing protein 14 isoform X2 n=1 Tax=Syngnathus acus TaxID=161584 RepID=UPI001885BEC7|nr:zinc finger CCCH domain-containing protein 14 isoform X2 [Syngnathus acus]
MEIGAEISKKIRAAIKGKLQELGAYIDEELPDYIMVMVANKKTSQQMADDLSLFLGNNTIKFTAWLHGVLEKLRTVAVGRSHALFVAFPAACLLDPEELNEVDVVSCVAEPASGEQEEQQQLVAGAPEIRTDECKSNSRSDRSEPRGYAHESRRGSVEKGSSRLTSAVKPLMELLPSEAVIDIKPEMDDDFGEDPVEATAAHRGARGGGGARPSLELYRPGHSKLGYAAARSAEGSSHGRRQESRSGRRTSRGDHSKEESSSSSSRKRKAPVVSSVVRVNRDSDEESGDADEEEEDAGYGGRGPSSRVLLPSKPERKPSLPPAKQANRNLILKAISEAQDSINKTTSFPALPLRQTVPVAPRARLAREEEMTAAIQLAQQHPHGGGQSYAPEKQPGRTLAAARSAAASHAPSDSAQRNHPDKPDDASGDAKRSDTRSFIVSRPPADGSASRQPERKQKVESALPRTVQASKEKENSASPKFIVTLEGVPSPLGDLAESEMELDDVRPPSKSARAAKSKVCVLQRPHGGPSMDTSLEDEMDVEIDDDSAPSKRPKVMERCKFWPVCKSGDECPYHHPTRTCKTFPSCKFGDKCLFIHPNCKYDARCSKPDCPYTHVSRRGATAAPPARPVVPPAPTVSMCRFFPQCKKMDCPFYHPKPCHFAGQCNRDGCTFFHPNASVPPRHALKWTKTQSS